jgi:glycosyltransferase involved in cell wall biosynthesis
MKKISWFSLNHQDASGDSWYSQGYFNAALSTIKALQDKQCAVFYNREDIPYHINFCPPTYYQHKSKYTVGYTPWESTKVPNHWIENMRRCDEVWATSNFVRDIYLKNGVNANIHVIPHGISKEFSVIERELTGRFNFLHIGGDSKRKNAQMVVDAFLELFEGDDDYRLILKYNKFCYAEVYINNRLVPASVHPQIIAIPDNFETEDLVSLYHKAHCMVYPTMGEGFGMIPFEAIATGLPTIVTNLTGCADFAKLGIPLEAEFDKANWNDHLYETDTGNWASPDFEQLIQLMQHVVNEYDEFKKYAARSARIIHSEWSWASTADKILKRLEFYENSLS